MQYKHSFIMDWIMLKVIRLGQGDGHVIPGCRMIAMPRMH